MTKTSFTLTSPSLAVTRTLIPEVPAKSACVGVPANVFVLGSNCSQKLVGKGEPFANVALNVRLASSKSRSTKALLGNW